MNVATVVGWRRVSLFFFGWCLRSGWSFLVRTPKLPATAHHGAINNGSRIRWRPPFAKGNKAKRGNNRNGDNSGDAVVALEDDKDDEVDVHHVSEATALLACRAYLQRRHRLGPWEGWKERQTRRKAASSTGGSGFFWEDPSELRYYVSPNTKRKRQVAGDVDAASGEGDEVDSRSAPTKASRRRDRSEECDDLEQEDSACSTWELASFPHTLQEDEIMDELCDEAEPGGGGDDGGEPEEQDEGSADAASAAAYDEFPPETHLRRSQAARATWSDSRFRERWYKSRWLGKKKKKSDPEEDKLRRSSGTPFPMEQVAAMTEDEITHAIRSYVSSKQKRSATKTQKSREPPDSSGHFAVTPSAERVALSSLLPDEELLKQRRQERAQRAAKAYQKRLQRQRQSSTSKTVTVPPPLRKLGKWSAPTDDQPEGALLRIEAALATGRDPSIGDVQLVLRPTRLARRKDVLRRVLASLGRWGKCLPPLAYLTGSGEAPTFDLESVEDSELTFVSQGSVDHLGAFCIWLLRQRNGRR